MNEIELERQLRLWGRYYGEGKPPEWDDITEREGVMVGLGSMMLTGGYGANPIAVAMDFGGQHTKATAVAYARPREAVKYWRDPTPCIESRHYCGALYFSGAEQGKGVDPIATLVEKAALDLYRIDTIKGLVLRANYCKRGTQSEKTEWVNEQGRAAALKLRTYRDELAHARTWMWGRLA